MIENGIRAVGIQIDAISARTFLAMAETKVPRKVPLIGHLPIARQFHVLGVMLVTFVVDE